MQRVVERAEHAPGARAARAWTRRPGRTASRRRAIFHEALGRRRHRAHEARRHGARAASPSRSRASSACRSCASASGEALEDLRPFDARRVRARARRARDDALALDGRRRADPGSRATAPARALAAHPARGRAGRRARLVFFVLFDYSHGRRASRCSRRCATRTTCCSPRATRSPTRGDVVVLRRRRSAAATIEIVKRVVGARRATPSRSTGDIAWVNGKPEPFRTASSSAARGDRGRRRSTVPGGHASSCSATTGPSRSTAASSGPCPLDVDPRPRRRRLRARSPACECVTVAA